MMVKTVQAALSPLLILGFLCGLNFFEDSFGRIRPYLTCLYFVILWSLYTYFFYYLVIESYIPYIYYTTWPNIISMLFAIISVIVSLYQFKKLKMCLHLLSVVDDTLEALGTSKEYRHLYNYVLRLTIVWFITVFIINIIDVFSLNYRYHFSISRIFAPFVGNYLFHVTALCSFTWGTILRYISSRFRKIKEYICNIVKDSIKFINKRNKKKVTEQRMKARKYMWSMMSIHLQLCLISRELNKVFSIQMTLQMATYFAYFIEISRYLYSSYASRETRIPQLVDKLFIYLWVVAFSVQLLALNYICQSVCDKANDAVASLYNLFNNSRDKDLCEQALQFVLQIKQRKLKFSGMGLFDFGYKFIYRFYKAIVTVLVIIIQMRITADELLLPEDKP